MIVITPTIMHTGTHLLRHHVLRERELFGPGEVRFFHVDRKFPQDMHGADFIFSTLRHPARVAESFARRLHQFSDRTYEAFCLQWDRMIDHYSRHVDAFIHPDHETRDTDVAHLATLTGLPLQCEWPVSVKTGAKYGTHDVALDRCPEVPERYVDFYESTLRGLDG